MRLLRTENGLIAGILNEIAIIIDILSRAFGTGGI